MNGRKRKARKQLAKEKELANAAEKNRRSSLKMEAIEKAAASKSESSVSVSIFSPGKSEVVDLKRINPHPQLNPNTHPNPNTYHHNTHHHELHHLTASIT